MTRRGVWRSAGRLLPSVRGLVRADVLERPRWMDAVERFPPVPPPPRRTAERLMRRIAQPIVVASEFRYEPSRVAAPPLPRETLYMLGFSREQIEAVYRRHRELQRDNVFTTLTAPGRNDDVMRTIVEEDTADVGGITGASAEQTAAPAPPAEPAAPVAPRPSFMSSSGGTAPLRGTAGARTASVAGKSPRRTFSTASPARWDEKKDKQTSATMKTPEAAAVVEGELANEYEGEVHTVDYRGSANDIARATDAASTGGEHPERDGETIRGSQRVVAALPLDYVLDNDDDTVNEPKDKKARQRVANEKRRQLAQLEAQEGPYSDAVTEALEPLAVNASVGDGALRALYPTVRDELAVGMDVVETTAGVVQALSFLTEEQEFEKPSLNALLKQVERAVAIEKGKKPTDKPSKVWETLLESEFNGLGQGGKAAEHGSGSSTAGSTSSSAGSGSTASSSTSASSDTDSSTSGSSETDSSDTSSSTTDDSDTEKATVDQDELREIKTTAEGIQWLVDVLDPVKASEAFAFDKVRQQRAWDAEKASVTEQQQQQQPEVPVQDAAAGGGDAQGDDDKPFTKEHPKELRETPRLLQLYDLYRVLLHIRSDQESLKDESRLVMAKEHVDVFDSEPDDGSDRDVNWRPDEAARFAEHGMVVMNAFEEDPPIKELIWGPAADEKFERALDRHANDKIRSLPTRGDDDTEELQQRQKRRQHYKKGKPSEEEQPDEASLATGSETIADAREREEDEDDDFAELEVVDSEEDEGFPYPNMPGRRKTRGHGKRPFDFDQSSLLSEHPIPAEGSLRPANRLSAAAHLVSTVSEAGHLLRLKGFSVGEAYDHAVQIAMKAKTVSEKQERAVALRHGLELQHALYVPATNIYHQDARRAQRHRAYMERKRRGEVGPKRKRFHPLDVHVDSSDDEAIRELVWPGPILAKAERKTESKWTMVDDEPVFQPRKEVLEQYLTEFSRKNFDAESGQLRQGPMRAVKSTKIDIIDFYRDAKLWVQARKRSSALAHELHTEDAREVEDQRLRRLTSRMIDAEEAARLRARAFTVPAMVDLAARLKFKKTIPFKTERAAEEAAARDPQAAYQSDLEHARDALGMARDVYSALHKPAKWSPFTSYTSTEKDYRRLKKTASRVDDVRRQRGEVYRAVAKRIGGVRFAAPKYEPKRL